VVNIQDYTPKDSDFTSSKPKGNKVEKHIFTSLKEIREEEQEDGSLNKTIQHLEESIKEKEKVMVELWKNIKMEKEELNFLKNKRDEQWEREMFGHDTEIETSESKQINGFEDRLVIYVDIKVSGYLQYTLDAQLDTGAMNSCAKYGAIPSYYWQPIDIAFRAVNKTEIRI
jgi:hypothetical protein